MQTVGHQEQQEIWEKEHKKPQVLPQIASIEASSRVMHFSDWLKARGENLSGLKGIEMCCGKGRNVIWLASQGANVTGLDFSAAAIKEARARAKKAGFEGRANFVTHDVTLPYPVKPNSLDFAVDCFGSTDIESAQGRRAAQHNLVDVLKPGGYLVVYLLSTDDEYFKDMAAVNPGPEPGSFVHPVSRKYEKSFTEEEIKNIDPRLKLLTIERVPKQVTILGKKYNGNYIWAVFSKTV